MSPTLVEAVAAGLFALALLHTFSVAWFERLAQRQPLHARLWHLFAEVEIVFGFWAIVLVAALIALQGQALALEYVDTRNYVEPLFVFAIMIVAASRPVLNAAESLTRLVAALLPLSRTTAVYFAALSLIPLLGSLLTEPGAMTLAALLLRDLYFRQALSTRMRYATLGVLFVNVSIGGALTPFAAPPVLMVTQAWSWDLAYMLRAFGGHVLPIVLLNAAGATLAFRRELRRLPEPEPAAPAERVPLPMVLLHLALLAGIVVFAHHPPMFLALMLLFLGIASAYPQHQDRILLREALLVAFFLAGLVMLGGLQQWWLRPLLAGLGPIEVFLGATALTAITDNAALTYLASQVPDLDAAVKFHVVAGALTGGGLTVIANAPNPAGLSILKPHFPDGVVSAGRLFLAALPPTLLAIASFLLF